MEFEDLQAIWDTQNERPVFALNDSRLAVGLYQQRERSRRRLFREQFAPMYVAVLFVAGFSAFLFVVFFVKTVTKMRLTDPQMSVWDGAALVAALAAALAVVVPMYAERRKHERAQNLFAPSLREELERGIAQLDFELSMRSKPRVRRIAAFVAVGATVIMWETGRLNGEAAPWMALAIGFFCLFPSTWGFAKASEIVQRLTQRKRALESMRAGLEDVG